MKRWLTVSLIGSGNADDPYRPDLKDVLPDTWTLATTDGRQALIKVGGQLPILDALSDHANVTSHGDEQAGDSEPPLPAQLRLALVAEAIRLQASSDWTPDACDVEDT